MWPRVPHRTLQGRVPALIWLSTLYLHCTCTLKERKNLAENEEEKKDAALGMEAAAVCQQTGRGNNAKLPASLPALVMDLASLWRNATSGTACGSLLLSRKASIPKGSASGSWPVAEDVRALCYCRSHRRNLHCKISNTLKLPVQSCTPGRALLKSFLMQQSLDRCYWASQISEFGAFVLVCRVHLHLIFLGLCGLIVNSVALHVLHPPFIPFFWSLSFNYPRHIPCRARQ